MAALIPRGAIEVGKQEKLGGGHTAIGLRVVNRGYLGTYGLTSAKKLPLSEPMRLTVEGVGVKIAAPAESVVEIGHLDGWGQGLYSGTNVFFPWTRGNVHEKFVTLVVAGAGTIKVQVGSVRVGYRTLAVSV